MTSTIIDQASGAGELTIETDVLIIGGGVCHRRRHHA